MTAVARQVLTRLPEQGSAAAVGIGVAVIYLAVTTWAMRTLPFDRWMLFFLLPALILAGFAIISAVTARDDVPLTGLISAALLVKMVATVARYFVVVSVYGTGDALAYDRRGVELADSYRAGEISFLQLFPTESGTPAMDHLTGLLYAIMGPSILGGFFVFSWLAFFGLFLFHRAARIGLPEGDQRRYVILVLFLPSLLFWPSSIGKESVVMLGLGIAAYGAARVLERQAGGWVSFVLGTAVVYLIRPHVAAVLVGALGVAFLFRRTGSLMIGPIVKLGFVGAIMVAMAWVLGRAVERLLPNASDDSAEAVTQLLDKAAYGTAEGNATVESAVPNSLFDYPSALINVLVRPFVFEASNFTQLMAAVETTALLVLVVISWKRIRNLPVLTFRRPYLLFSIVYTGVFSFAWSSFMNLGAIARQRVQVWPFLLLLLVLPLVVEKVKAKKAPAVRPMLAAPMAAAPSGRRRIQPASARVWHDPKEHAHRDEGAHSGTG